MTVATAESCTGGLLASRITDIAGSSAYFMGGAVVYTAAAKQDLAGVASGLHLLEDFGDPARFVDHEGAALDSEVLATVHRLFSPGTVALGNRVVPVAMN